MYIPVQTALGLIISTAVLFYFVTTMKWYWQVMAISVWATGLIWIIKAFYFVNPLADTVQKVFT